jgi:vitamin B12 transporter
MRKILQTLLCVIIMTNVVRAQDTLKTQALQETVVLGTRFDVPAERSGKVIFKIGADQLQTRFAIADALNEVPGVQSDGNFGTPGTNMGYYIRGGRSRQTLIMIDGVPMSDPSGIEPFYDLRFVSTSQVDQVEVFQGGLSTLYGSGASAAVINIQTKNSVHNGIHGGVGLQAGSWNTFNQNVNLNGKQDKFFFQLSGSNLSSKGFSAAQEPERANGYDSDGVKSRNGLLKLGYKITSSLKADVFGSVDWFDADSDAGAFIDGEDSQRLKQNRIGGKITQTYSKGSVALTAQHTNINRKIAGSFPTEYDGRNWFGELVHKHDFNAHITLLSGVSIQNLSYDEKRAVSKDTTSFTIIDPYTSVLFTLPSGFNLHAGIRLNNHSDYRATLLYNVNPSWLIDMTNAFSVKPFASVSTSFITPTLFQLHTPWGGNVDLKPEESVNYEYGFSVYLADQVTFTAVNFFREERDVIGYTMQYENISDKRKVKGITLDLKYKPIQLLVISGDFSWVTSTDKSSFYRIPARKAGASLHVNPLTSTAISIRYQYTSKRTDLYYDEFFNPNDIELSSYRLIDLSVSQKLLKEHLSFHAGIYNLLDESFIGIYGYTTRGRNFSIGLTYSF